MATRTVVGTKTKVEGDMLQAPPRPAIPAHQAQTGHSPGTEGAPRLETIIETNHVPAVSPLHRKLDRATAGAVENLDTIAPIVLHLITIVGIAASSDTTIVSANNHPIVNPQAAFHNPS